MDEELNKIPMHVGIVIDGLKEYAGKNHVAKEQINEIKFLHIKNVIKVSSRLKIPILTIHLYDKIEMDEVDFLDHFFEELSKWEVIHEHQIKISVFGQWYKLPDRVVTDVKKVIEETSEYDKFFLNFLINYDGQEEIADAIKLIGTKIKFNKIDPERINKEIIKEHLYTSNFLPPEIIIYTGKQKKTKGFLLWDSAQSNMIFTNILWPEFGKDDFIKILKEN